MLNITTACPLDCYDACEINYENNKITALKRGHTKGFLCPHMNHYETHKTIKTPSYKGKEISLNEALKLLSEILKKSIPNEVLHYRSNGNFALMQEVCDHFFTSFGATLTDGSLCDGAAEAGIIAGRGSNKNMPLSQIEKSEVVIFWGRNPHTTSSHILPLIKNKKIIVIDPIKTKIAKMADLHIQIKPRGDLYLAMLLSRFLYIYDDYDSEFLDKFGSEFEEYHELTQSLRIVLVLKEIGVELSELEEILEIVKNKKVAIVCGVGIQKYANGADIMRAIDAFGIMLGLFAKEGCGIAYLGASKEHIISPFNAKAKKISKVDTEFSNFKTVFIQGANPLSQMPNTKKVKESIDKVENIIYFGLFENETSQVADLIIPAKSFLYKNDIRTSYSHNNMMIMNKILDTDDGISEYDLSNYLCQEFNINIESENFYLQYFKSFAIKKENGEMVVKNREEIPYKNGFDTKNGEFEFLEEFEMDSFDNEMLNLITSKSPVSLNSQFHRDKYVYLNPSLGYRDDEMVKIFSQTGSVNLRVKLSDDIRGDCVLIHSGTKGVNSLTTSKHSYDGKNAIYQELMVKIDKIKEK